MSFFVVGLTFLNIICWIIFFIKFKKIFSTDKIIEQTRHQMNNMIKDIDSATDRDMYLVRESTKNIKALLDEADKRMEVFASASLRLKDILAETEKHANAVGRKPSVLDSLEQKPVVRKSITNPQIESYLRNSKSSYSSTADSSYEVVNKNDVQPDLFSSDNQSSILKDETIVTKEGAAFKEVPMIITEIYEDKPVVPVVENSISNEPKEKSLKTKVSELYNQGYKSEEIALALSCSITEVDFIIDML